MTIEYNVTPRELVTYHKSEYRKTALLFKPIVFLFPIIFGVFMTYFYPSSSYTYNASGELIDVSPVNPVVGFIMRGGIGVGLILLLRWFKINKVQKHYDNYPNLSGNRKAIVEGDTLTIMSDISNTTYAIKEIEKIEQWGGFYILIFSNKQQLLIPEKAEGSKELVSLFNV